MKTRREFLKVSSLGSLASVIVTLQPRVQAQQSPSPALVERKDVSRLAPSAPEIVAYANAVGAMKRLPISDPRSWRRQAQIHFDFCPHGNWWFLPWHRAYLHYFEEVCRDVLGNRAFALPYWDWSRGPRIPAPFWGGPSNPLFHAREIGANDDIPSEYVGLNVIAGILDSVSITPIYSGATTTDNQRQSAAYGALEATPHNNVHGEIGLDMGTFWSPLDPIFWLHHANIDRLWSSWLQARGHVTPSEPLWSKHQLEGFYDPRKKGDVAELTANTRNEARYGYRYDRYEATAVSAQTAPISAMLAFVQTGVTPTGTARVDSVTAQFGTSTPLFGARKTMVSLTSPVEMAVNRALETIPKADVLLVLEGVQRPSKRSVACRVFLNCREPSINTPTDDPSYVGTIGFFGDTAADHKGHPGEGRGATYVLDLRPTIARLQRIGAYSTRFDVAIVPFSTRGEKKPLPDEEVKVQNIRVVGLTS